MPNELLIAYTEYVERMYEQSDELVSVYADTVPDHINIPALLEWADLIWP